MGAVVWPCTRVERRGRSAAIPTCSEADLRGRLRERGVPSAAAWSSDADANACDLHDTSSVAEQAQVDRTEAEKVAKRSSMEVVLRLLNQTNCLSMHAHSV